MGGFIAGVLYKTVLYQICWHLTVGYTSLGVSKDVFFVVFFKRMKKTFLWESQSQIDDKLESAISIICESLKWYNVPSQKQQLNMCTEAENFKGKLKKNSSLRHLLMEVLGIKWRTILRALQ